MKKSHKIIYWIATLWLSLGMVSTGIVQILQQKEELDFITKLGYPDYFLVILSVWKILGVIAILIPNYPLLKEWAYAGFFFVMSGALLSHLIKADPFSETAPSILLLLLILVSWWFRPASRKLVTVTPSKI